MCCGLSFLIWRSGGLMAVNARRIRRRSCSNVGVRFMAWCDFMSLGFWRLAGSRWGGRMASLLADELGADALVCLGYPFYAVGKPEKPRVEHLASLQTRTLIVQGERDALGNREAVEGYSLSPEIEVFWLAAGDHDLKPLKVSGFTHEQHLAAAAERVADFLATHDSDHVCSH